MSRHTDRQDYLNGCHLRTLRQRAGLRYCDMDTLTWGRHNYRKYEVGEYDINRASLYQIRELAKLFGCQPSDIVTDPDLKDYLGAIERSQASWRV